MPQSKKIYQALKMRIKTYGEDILTASGDAVGDFDPQWLKEQEKTDEE